ncbi:lacticin 481 family lantibiotic [Bacillus cereus]|uniref:lacticin 481 family lantibiotic n=1 Tax=Bacillus cereus TaxID=1396 RepID=UPI000BF3A941|nr:lacticin 481 family lantibiotic [Bacillus cereus]PES12346.1 lantibiotic lacticin [Bacillus cereus]PEX16945.1 lantibiotic lacticin [Bacillus cereus]PEY48539.1 lantibiotic lacticin [Bacillus cereus]PFC35616.1 lantibiotic lacticin [Bacillus cereus]PFQ72082.1 lantibiotic lacticin [Bacillus cereus]
MEKNFELKALEAINDLTDAELENVVGAGNGQFNTISHECHWNTWQFMFTCCS